ncbi:MAG: DUF362 domain-containing protein [Candidatus Competibacteraceae bacterium]
MNRREFLQTSLGVLAGAGLSLNPSTRLFATDAGSASYDLVAVKGGGPEAMFDQGIQALGGMQTFVKKGQTVVIKPNMAWDVPPERAANTNPRLVKRIAEQCLNADAKEVYVFDNTCDNWEKSYRNSGIEKAIKEAGGKIAPGNSEKYYQAVNIPNGRRLTEAKEHELILAADVFINVPILKQHESAMLTVSMKNLMGAIWDRGYWHRHDLHQCIADFATYRKPNLIVVDAYYVLKRNGPRGVSVGDVVPMKAQLLATNMVTADAAAAKLFGIEPDSVDYIRIAHEMGVGRKDLENLSIKRIKL